MIVPPVSWISAMGPGDPCTAGAMAGRDRPKNATGTPNREAAYQPVSGRPIMKA